jgi:hypothetical protein
MALKRLPDGYQIDKASETLFCPFCGYIGSFDDWDVLGLGDDGQCLECGWIGRWKPISKRALPRPLFEGAHLICQEAMQTVRKRPVKEEHYPLYDPPQEQSDGFSRSVLPTAVPHRVRGP